MYCYLPLAPPSLLFSIHNAVYKEINELDQKLDQLSTMGDTNRYTFTFFSYSILQENCFSHEVTSNHCVRPCLELSVCRQFNSSYPKACCSS